MPRISTVGIANKAANGWNIGRQNPIMKKHPANENCLLDWHARNAINMMIGINAIARLMGRKLVCIGPKGSTAATARADAKAFLLEVMLATIAEKERTKKNHVKAVIDEKNDGVSISRTRTDEAENRCIKG